jgi:molybdenum cofactor cytidylyltransferase
MIPSATSIIVLAAGGSTRLGLPKQLLQYGDKSLLRTIVEKALLVQPLELIVVLGFEAERMANELEDLELRIVINREWREGIASSVRAGVNAVSAHANGALISLCDQPAVTPELFGNLISICTAEKPIAATEYHHVLGVPACYLRSVFPELLLLQGDTGAKHVIASDKTRVASYPFPDAALDVDTLGDIPNQ